MLVSERANILSAVVLTLALAVTAAAQQPPTQPAEQQAPAKPPEATEPAAKTRLARIVLPAGTKLPDRKSTRLNSSHSRASRMPSSA